MTRPVLGLDIAKATFDACLLMATGTRQRKVIPNASTGFGLLSRWLDQHTSESVMPA